ncbi:hypothetical protein B7R22_14470 [Subtercola boreus]|uniref:Uncharacterized protein n=1 Tax=Subtercola boreus TaxID=120213 RepID=A0A3E0VS76_9MICO|nr:hypothetical protein B7R22_14470 [Subtercola boreus]
MDFVAESVNAMHPPALPIVPVSDSTAPRGTKSPVSKDGTSGVTAVLGVGFGVSSLEVQAEATIRQAAPTRTAPDIRVLTVLSTARE